jgi:hypothetical protein
MSLRNWIEVHPRAISVGRILGLCVFVIAFFLPACRAGSYDNFKGWECAQQTLGAFLALFGKPNPEMPFYIALLVALSGLINPIILLIFSFSLWQRFVLPRRILAMAVLACMAATWTFFVLWKLTPLIGHYLWIAGALVILAPDAIGGKRKPAAPVLPSRAAN